MTSFELNSDESPVAGTHRIWLECIDDTLSAAVDESLEVDAAIHQARKTFKRIRALLRLLRFATEEQHYRRENYRYRDFGRYLSGIRDSAAMLEALDSVKEKAVSSGLADEFDVLQTSFLIRHAKLSDPEHHDKRVLSDLVPSLEEARKAAQNFPLSDHGFKSCGLGIRRIFRQARLRMERAETTGHEEEFHEWRKRTKYLWHQTEVLVPAWRAPLGILADEYHRLSSLLGDEHDLSVLMQLLHTEEDLHKAGPRLARLLAKRQGELRREALALGARLFLERPGMYASRLAGYHASWILHAPSEQPTTFEHHGIIPYKTTREYALAHGLSVQAVRRRIRMNDLPAIKENRRWYIPTGTVANDPEVIR